MTTQSNLPRWHRDHPDMVKLAATSKSPSALTLCQRPECAADRAHGWETRLHRADDCALAKGQPEP